MRVLVVTSCTGKKSIAHARHLTREDFARGPEHVASREWELADHLTPAEDLYTGQQHVRLMRGLRHLRQQAPDRHLYSELWIVSAGYGLIPSTQEKALYRPPSGTPDVRFHVLPGLVVIPD